MVYLSKGEALSDVQSTEDKGLQPLGNARSGPLVSFYHSSLNKTLLNSALLVSVAPIVLLLILGIAVFLSLFGNGPVFFSQDRVGQNGSLFKCLKFRTMLPDADDILTELLRSDAKIYEEWRLNRKLTDDPRFCRFGSFMRKSSLDELPQIFNVLKGEMALIGPRPIVAEELKKYGRYAAHYMSVRPGVTGLWQVSGRSRLSYARRIALDVVYVKNGSLKSDLAILIKTPLVVLTARGAV